MNNFVFYSPTEFVFGKNTEVQVGALARKYGAQKVMIGPQQKVVDSVVCGDYGRYLVDGCLFGTPLSD